MILMMCTYAMSALHITGTVCSEGEGEGEDGEELSKMAEAEEGSALHMLVSGKNFDEVCSPGCTRPGVEWHLVCCVPHGAEELL